LRYEAATQVDDGYPVHLAAVPERELTHALLVLCIKNDPMPPHVHCPCAPGVSAKEFKQGGATRVNLLLGWFHLDRIVRKAVGRRFRISCVPALREANQ
jgi:hypothetical protein